MVPPPLVKRLLEGVGLAASALVALVCCPVTFFYQRPTHPTLGDPKPLPKRRVDIRSRPQATQPENCYFFNKLPLELRLVVYEHAIAHRQIRMYLSDDKKKKRRFVDSSSFTEDSPQYTQGGPAYRDVRSSPLLIALLRVCRQVYVEAHEILFSKNTFDVFPNELEIIMRYGLGENLGRPHIKRLRVHYWYMQYQPDVFFSDPQPTVFKHIAAMPELTHLSFLFAELRVFDPNLPRQNYQPDKFLTTRFGRTLLGIQNPNLQKVELKFVYRRRQGEEDSDIYPPEYTHWKILAQTVNDLIVGSRSSRVIAVPR